MWLRIGTFLGLSVWLVLATANDARAQDVLWVPRSQLFAAVLGQEIGQTLAYVMNAYALGKARKKNSRPSALRLPNAATTAPMRLKIRVSAVQFRPWAPLIPLTFLAFKSPKTALFHIATRCNRKRAFSPIRNGFR